MSEADTERIEEPTGPYPPRYRWLKRMGAMCALLLIGLALLRLWWGQEAKKRLAASIADLRARGEPTSADDLSSATLPDAENAAYYLKLAASKINPTIDCPSSSNYIWNDDILPCSKKWFAMEEKAAAADQAAFADLREARRHPKAQWITTYPSPLAMVLLPHLSSARDLANHAADYAMLLHFHGDDAEALEMIQDLFAQANAIEGDPFLISHLVANGIRALGTDRLQKIAPELTVRGVSPTTNPLARPASRQQVQQMIERLCDSGWRTKAMSRAYSGERLMQTDLILRAADKTWVLRPMLELDAAHTFASANSLEVAARQPNWPAAQNAMKAIGDVRTSNPARVVGQAIVPALDRAAEIDFRSEGERRLAAVSLAFRLYRLDHAGTYPPTLAALVPTYVPAIPLDPFAADDRPLGYIIVENGRRPIAYSVGTDGKDNIAAGAPIPKRPLYGWNGIKEQDQYLDLSRWIPPVSATGESELLEEDAPDN